MKNYKFIFSCGVLISLFSQMLHSAEVMEEPSDDPGLFSSTTPPKVLIGLAYVPELADADPNDWTFVRENLDGVWVNGAGTGIDAVETIVDSLVTRDYMFIGSINSVDYQDDVLQSLTLSGAYKSYYDRLIDTAIDPKIVLVNDYVTKQASNPLRYYGHGYVRKAKEYLENEVFNGVNPFDSGIYITTRKGHFDSNVYNKTYDVNSTGEIVGRSYTTMKNVVSNHGGWAYERSPIEMHEPENRATYIKAFNRARELGAEVIWLANRGNTGTPKDYTDGLVDAYDWFRENEIFPDKIVVINYSRAAADGEIDYLKMLPMLNKTRPSRPHPGSFTGALYWAIKQRQNN